MPLRALLLLPSGEQPTILDPKPKPKPKPSNLTIPKAATLSVKDALTSPFSKSIFSSSSLPSSPGRGGQSATATTGTEEDVKDDGLAFYRNDLGWPFEYVFDLLFIILRGWLPHLSSPLFEAVPDAHTALTSPSLSLHR
jgi:hypothetical protein